MGDVSGDGSCDGVSDVLGEDTCTISGVGDGMDAGNGSDDADVDTGVGNDADWATGGREDIGDGTRAVFPPRFAAVFIYSSLLNPGSIARESLS